MGYFDNIIADSRGASRAAAPAAGPTTDLPGMPPLSWPVDNIPLWQNDAALAPPDVETLTPTVPSPTVSESATPVRSATVVGETSGASIIAAATPATATISQPTSEAGRAHVTDATDAASPTTAAKGSVSQPAPWRQQTAIPAAAIPALQRQSATPDRAGATPSPSQASLPVRQEITPLAPVAPRSPHGGITAMGESVLTGQEAQARGSQTVTPPSSDLSDAITSNATEEDVAAAGATFTAAASVTPPAQPRLEAPARPVSVSAPSIPSPGAQTPPHMSQHIASRAPQVRIGQINVVIEAPAAPRPPARVAQSGNLSSRLFLRSL